MTYTIYWYILTLLRILNASLRNSFNFMQVPMFTRLALVVCFISVIIIQSEYSNIIVILIRFILEGRYV